MRNNRQIKEEVLARELPEIKFPVCIKQGESYFRYFHDGKFEHISVRVKGLEHIQTSFSFGKLTWLSDYTQEIKTLVRRHGEISQENFIDVVKRYFENEYEIFFSGKEIQSETLKPKENYFPENEIFTNNEKVDQNGECSF